MPIFIAVEGLHDLAVARRLLDELQLTEAPGPGSLEGKPKLDAKLRAYAASASVHPWFVLRDLDRDAACAGELVRQLVPQRPPLFHLRIAVRSVEAWLLADHVGMAGYLHAPVEKVPRNPDSLESPKTELVNLARKSSSRKIVTDIVPDEGGGRPTGKAYTARVIDFVRNTWRPAAAAERSPSLARCLRALRTLGRG